MEMSEQQQEYRLALAMLQTTADIAVAHMMAGRFETAGQVTDDLYVLIKSLSKEELEKLLMVAVVG